MAQLFALTAETIESHRVPYVLIFIGYLVCEECLWQIEIPSRCFIFASQILYILLRRFVFNV